FIICLCSFYIFFFSSRRRHTRSTRDWSSDVCSSDLRDANPTLKWEQTAQFNVALDYGFLNNRVSGSVEYYVKNTSDLLLQVSNAQPAFAEQRLANVGKVRNKGLEISIDALALSRPNFTWRAGLVFAAERNRVV